MTGSFVIVLTFVIYMFIVLGVGMYATRFTKTMDDFFLAGRKLGSLVTSISSVASSESGWVVLGLVGVAYKEGLSAVWIAPGCLLGYLVNWYFLASRLRKVSKSMHSLTIPDFLEDKFKDVSHTIRYISVIIIFFSMMGYVGAQFNAAGKAFDAVFHIKYINGVLLGASITIIYTLFGGFRAVSWTDVLQGLMMVFGLVFLPILSIIHIGGFSNLFHKLYQIDPALLTLTGKNVGFALVGMVIGYLGIGLGYPGQPHVVTRYMAANSEDVLKKARLIAITWGIFTYYGAIFLGLSGRVIIPHLTDPEYTFPNIALKLLSPILAGVMLAAILSAIRSTADSQLLVAASAIARDIYQKIFRTNPPEKKLVLISRLTVLVLGLLSMLLAMTKSRVVFWFVLFAWSGLGASFGPLILLSLYWKGITKWGAVAGMIVGFLTTIVWKLTNLSDKIIYELVPAFIFAALSIIIVSLLTRRENVSTG
ncbi:MAG: symporter [Candidatus Cloacimonas sp. 4484_209]|nr:MAG: symporter [Candidatus Cloacimonas sp. 4484_209]